ncbi:hypothetical protein FHU29_000497 [Hoyosella altamirensis]|uniref:Uncharacterized protein n=1 Tax=Hoyosella altamirensis TaxID=616997 RepID=A0A839RJ03_9ACTN|nr:hypothetical protein [Hoyosella altamirensis]
MFLSWTVLLSPVSLHTSEIVFGHRDLANCIPQMTGCLRYRGKDSTTSLCSEYSRNGAARSIVRPSAGVWGDEC